MVAAILRRNWKNACLLVVYTSILYFLHYTYVTRRQAQFSNAYYGQNNVYYDENTLTTAEAFENFDKAAKLQEIVENALEHNKKPQKIAEEKNESAQNNEAKLVLLLTYQKSGSSFLGELFNNHQKAFYWFEPLDGTYVSMYGLAMGWTVPSDITNLMNGTVKTPPEHEVTAVSNTLSGILNCDFRTMPNDALWHSYLGYFKAMQKDLGKYTHCISQQKKDNPDSFKCRDHLKKTCPVRYGRNAMAMEMCKRFLPWIYKPDGKTGEPEYLDEEEPVDYSRFTGDLDRVSVPVSWDKISKKQKKIFTTVRECKATQRDLIFKCIPELEEICKPAEIRSIKAIRLTMDSVEKLLGKIKNLKVVHFYRDPRAVALSRLGHGSYRGIYAGREIVKEAQLYCQTLLRDLQIRKRLEKIYPKAFLEVTFEKLAEDPFNTADDIYKFIGADIPSSVVEWLEQNTKGSTKRGRKGRTSKNSTAILQKWQNTMSYTEVHGVNDVCRPLFKYLQNSWPGTTL